MTMRKCWNSGGGGGVGGGGAPTPTNPHTLTGPPLTAVCLSFLPAAALCLTLTLKLLTVRVEPRPVVVKLLPIAAIRFATDLLATVIGLM